MADDATLHRVIEDRNRANSMVQSLLERLHDKASNDHQSRACDFAALLQHERNEFDDQFTIHRKVSGLTDAAFRLHVEAIFWCARNLTDGFIAQDDLAIVSRYRRPEGYVTELVGRGAWDVVEGGWQIHDYLVWQQSRSKTLQTREARKKSGTLGGIKSGESRRKPRGKPKQVASEPLEPPSPLAPPTGGLGRGGGVQRSAGGKPHAFNERTDSPGWCTCDLPRANKIHTVGGRAA